MDAIPMAAISSSNQYSLVRTPTLLTPGSYFTLSLAASYSGRSRDRRRV